MNPTESLADYFALLGEPRQPWLDAEVLKEKFHRLTAAHHPDVSDGTADFTAINEAWCILRDPVLRLRHFLQLEFPQVLTASRPEIPEPLAEMFMRIGSQRRGVDEFLAREFRATSPLMRATLAGEKMKIIQDVEKLLLLASSAHDGLIAELKEIDWQTRPEWGGGQLVRIHHALSFFSKWLGQLREDLVRLSP